MVIGPGTVNDPPIGGRVWNKVTQSIPTAVAIPKTLNHRNPQNAFQKQDHPNQKEQNHKTKQREKERTRDPGKKFQRGGRTEGGRRHKMREIYVQITV